MRERLLLFTAFHMSESNISIKNSMLLHAPVNLCARMSTMYVVCSSGVFFLKSVTQKLVPEFLMLMESGFDNTPYFGSYSQLLARNVFGTDTSPSALAYCG